MQTTFYEYRYSTSARLLENGEWWERELLSEGEVYHRPKTSTITDMALSGDGSFKPDKVKQAPPPQARDWALLCMSLGLALVLSRVQAVPWKRVVTWFSVWWVSWLGALMWVAGWGIAATLPVLVLVVGSVGGGEGSMGWARLVEMHEQRGAVIMAGLIVAAGGCVWMS